MKKILLIFFILFPSTLLAGYGSGELKISESGVKGFYEYLQGRKGPPMRAVVTSDGSKFYWMYCPASNAMRCQAGSDRQVVSHCERKQALPCATFAVRRTVKWKNGINPGGKAAAFKKSMSLDEVRERLIQLGFVEKD
tara:strand:- start:70 stop:483 length:414 start_codon:yes stop_codon:yes gene_type:complete